MPAFSPFPTMFSIGLFIKVIQSLGYLGWSKFKAIAENKISGTEKLKFVFERVKMAMFNDGSQFRKQFLKRVTQGKFCEIISNSDLRFHRRFFFKEFLHVQIVQNAPNLQRHVYSRIKLSQTIFEKGHKRKIFVKLFQNLTISFREDFLKIFLRISSCLCTAKSPHSPEPC